MATIEQITADPRFVRATPEQKQRLMAKAENAPASLKQIVGESATRAVREASFRPGTISRDMITDPVTQAKALPPLLGAVGAISPAPGGATAGTVGGRQLSNAALRAYGRPEEVPSGLSQMMEAALAAAGDLGPIPAMNRRIFGKQVGQMERAAGIPDLVDSMKRPTGPDSTAKFIDWARKIRGNPGGETLKQIKDQIDFIYKNRKNVPISDIDEGKLKFLGRWVQQSLNKAAPGRGAAAGNLALSQTVPNYISKVAKAIPWWVKGTAGVLGGDALIRALSRSDGR